ncbi:MAG: [pyruvate, water dikinase]-phosphate phosphotransferase / [pyruvate, water dikinase] kinase [Eubacteriales bacterium]|nr:[pyruvate, water dikinase]-phosphate phosphotransferase / [pyruvate, water dikinase] kinase [Eubacteriales bacterium]
MTNQAGEKGKEFRPTVFVVSDSIGETAEFVARAAASQYNSERVRIRRFSYVNSPDYIVDIVHQAAEAGAIIAYTLVLPELREALEAEVRVHGVPAVDIMGPMLDALGKVMGNSPKLKPGLLHKLDEEYFHKMEAVEFAVKYDDGKEPRGILQADVVIIGVSRTSKTPLCMYLAHKKVKAANVPLVPEVEPPQELFQLPPRKVIGLTISPQQLNEIRTQRLKTLDLKSGAEYASMERIIKELDYAESIMRRIGCPIIDVTNRAVEETASIVLEIINKGDG